MFITSGQYWKDNFRYLSKNIVWGNGKAIWRVPPQRQFSLWLIWGINNKLADLVNYKSTARPRLARFCQNISHSKLRRMNILPKDMNGEFSYLVIVYKLLGSKYVQEKFHSNSKVKGRGILCFPRYFDVTLYVFCQPSHSKRWMVWK